MLPEIKVSATAMLMAKANGTVSELPRRARFKLTGEMLTVAIEGFPTAICHQGTNIEMPIRRRVEIPAARAMMLILFCIKSPLDIHGDANLNGLRGLNCDSIYVYDDIG